MTKARSTTLALKALRRALHVTTCWLSITAMVLGPVAPAMADVVASAGYGTKVTVDAGLTSVLGERHNANDVAVFDRFTVGAGEKVRLDMNAGAERMINIMRGQEKVEINGEVFSQRPDADVFFVTPGGFVLGAGGAIRTGALTVSTPTAAFRNSLLNDLRGGDGGSTLQSLLHGTEPLSEAGEIHVLGEIAARRLSLRAGKRLVLNGNITISGEGAGAGGYQAPAVNTGDIERAAAVQMRNGVLSLVSKGEVKIDGQVSVKNASGSAALTAQGRDIHVGLDKANSSLVVGAQGDAAAEASYIVMLAENSVSFENAVKIEVSGSPGAPSGLWASAKDISIGKATDAAPVTFDGGAAGSGLDVTLEASRSLSLQGLRSEATHFVGTAPKIDVAGRVQTDGGNVVLHGQDISVRNAQMDLKGQAGNGLLALIAEADNSTFFWPITNLSDTTAKIEIDRSTLEAGSVLITATAKGGNRFVDGVPTLEDVLAENMAVLGEDGSVVTDSTEFLAEALVDKMASGILAGTEYITAVIPVSVPVHSTDAKILITDSTISATGAATGDVPIRRVISGGDGERETRHAMHANGVLTDTWGFRTVKGAKELQLKLPSDWQLDHDAGEAMTGMYIRAHAQTDVSIIAGKVVPTAVAVGVGVMDTNSTVRITGNGRLLSDQDITVLSTAKDAFTGSVTPAPLANVAVGLLVSKQSLKNQLLIDVTQIDAGRDIVTGAITNRSHSATVTADASTQGTFALALNIGLVESHTEAAVNTRFDPAAAQTTGLRAGGDLRVTAETRYYANDRSTTSSLGYFNPLIAAGLGYLNLDQLMGKAWNTVRKVVLGYDPTAADPTPAPSKTAIGIGAALDVNIVNDSTHASLGGAYTDPATHQQKLFSDGRFIAGQTLQVKSGLDYAGGGFVPGPKRNVAASMGTMDPVIQGLLAAGKYIHPTLSEADILGQHDKAFMAAGGLSLFHGDSTVDLGGKIEGHRIDATAFRDYGSASGQLARYMEAQRLIDGTMSDAFARDPLDPTDVAEPYIPGVFDYYGLLTGYPITGGASTAAARSTLTIDGKPSQAQSLALGASVGAFATNHDVTVTIRDGAQLIADEALTLNAYEDGVFVFGNNLPVAMTWPGTPFSGDAQDVIGATAHVYATTGRVGIDIGAAQLEAQRIDAQARNALSTGGLIYSGGGATDLGVNLSLGGNILLKRTEVSVSGSAKFIGKGSASQIKLLSEDDSLVFLNALALTGSEGTSVGGGAVINFDGRKVDAHIRDLEDEAEAGQADAGSFELIASNRGRGYTGAVAAAVSGDPAPTAKPDENKGSAFFDNIVVDPFGDYLKNMSQIDVQTVAAQPSAQTPTPSAGDAKKSGLAIAGAAAVNLSIGHHAKASIGQGFGVITSGDAALRAEDRSVLIGITGGLSLANNSDADSKAAGGSLNIMQGDRNVSAIMRGSMVSTAGAVTVSAKDEALAVNIAVGGSGARNGSLAIAGSVALNVLTGDVTTKVFGTLSAAAKLTITAEDRATLIALGGSAAMAGAKGAKGAGLGAATNTYGRDTLVEIGAGSQLTAGSLLISAEFAAKIGGVAGSFVYADYAGAGGISVNTVTSSAKVSLAGTEASKISLTLTGQGEIRAKDKAVIYALGGAVGAGGEGAVGFGTAVNTIVNTTDLTMSHLTASGAGTGQLLSAVDAESRILALAAAGGVSWGDVAAAAGITVNTIRSSAHLTLSHGSFTDFARTDFNGTSLRSIQSLAGGVAFSAQGAAGAALSVNTITANDTRVTVKDTTFRGGAVQAGVEAKGQIDTIAVALGASKDLAIGGSIAVNDIRGTTSADILGGEILEATEVVQSAVDRQGINAFAGNGAVATTGAGFGVSVATNFISQHTQALGTYDLGGSNDTRIALSADNAARIKGYGATVAGGKDSAAGGSAVVGDIRNGAYAAYSGHATRAGDITISAKNDSDIELLSGAAVVGLGQAGVGAAITVAQILDTTRAELNSTKLALAGTVAVTANKTGRIEALAVSGAAGGQFGIGGSVVYTQIGRKSGVTGLSDAVATEDGSSPTDVALDEGEAQFDGLLSGLQTQTAAAGSTDLEERLTQGRASGEAHDVTEALVSLGGGGSFGALQVRARDAAYITTGAGAVGGGGAAGAGAAVAVNLNFSGTQARLNLGGGVSRSGLIDVGAYQSGDISSAVAAGAGGASFAGAGAISINVLQRTLKAEISGQPSTELLSTYGGLSLQAHQTGKIENTALTAAGSAEIAGGAAVAVNHLDDALTARVASLSLNADDTVGGLPKGKVVMEALSDQTVFAAAGALSASGGGALSGSVVVNTVGGRVELLTRDATFLAESLRAEARADRDISAYGGVGSFSTVGIGLATAVNKSVARVTNRHEGLIARTSGNIEILSAADTRFGGAVAGVAGGGVAISGTAVANTTGVHVTTHLGHSTRASDLAARGSMRIESKATAYAGLLSGGDQKPGANATVNVGATVGAGASVLVNKFRSTVKTEVDDQTQLVALGHMAFSDLDAGRGLRLSATSLSEADSTNINFGLGLSAGAAVLSSTTSMSDKTEVRLGDLAGSGLVRPGLSINGALTAEVAQVLGTDLAHAAQDVTIEALAKAEVDVSNLALGGGQMGGGAAITVTTFENEARILASGLSAHAEREINVEAKAIQLMKGWTMGLGGGAAAAAGSLEWRYFNGLAEIMLAGTSAVASGAAGKVNLSAHIETTSHGGPTAGAGGVIGAAGTLLRSVVDNKARILTRDVARVQQASNTAEDASLHTHITAAGDVALSATTSLDVETSSQSGVGGGLALGLSVSLLDVASQAVVDLGGATEVNAGRDMDLRAYQSVETRSQAGNFAPGIVGVGGALDRQIFTGQTSLSIGAGVTLTAENRMALSAQADRDLQSHVLSGQVGGIAVPLATSRIKLSGGGDAPADSNEADAEARTNAALSAEALSGGTGTGSGSHLTAKIGESAAQSDLLNGLEAVQNRGAGQADHIAVSFGEGATVLGGSELIITALSRTDIDQQAKASAPVAGLAIAPGKAVLDLASASEITVSKDVTLAARARIALEAGEYDLREGIRSRAESVAGGMALAVGTGSAQVDLRGKAVVTLGEGASLRHRDQALPGGPSVTISAERRLNASATVPENTSVSLLVGGGQATARVTDSGVAAIDAARTGSARGGISASSLALSVRTDGQLVALAHASAGGALGGGAGALAETRKTSVSRIDLEALDITVSGEVTLRNADRSVLDASAKGAALAIGIAAGVSRAEAYLGASVTTRLSEVDLSAARVSLDTVLSGAASADARSSGGGIGAGTGAQADVLSEYLVETLVASRLYATAGDLSILSRAEDLALRSAASGWSAGGIAGGSSVATIAHPGRAQGVVSTRVLQWPGQAASSEPQLSAFGALRIASLNAPELEAVAKAGSVSAAGGLGAETKVTPNLRTETVISESPGALRISAAKVAIAADTKPRLASSLDTTFGSIASVTAADDDLMATILNDVRVGSGAAIVSTEALDVIGTVALTLNDPASDVATVAAGGYGGVNVAAGEVHATISAVNRVTILDGAALVQLGPEALRIAAVNRFDLKSQMEYRTGGLAGFPRTEMRLEINKAYASVDVGAARLVSGGDLRVSAGSDIEASAVSLAYAAAAAAAPATSVDVIYNADNQIRLGQGATLEAERDLQLLSGHDLEGEQKITIAAEGRTVNNSAIPSIAAPHVLVKIGGAGLVSLAEGAAARAGRDVVIAADGGIRKTEAVGEAKDAYTAVYEAVGSLINGAFGGGPVSLSYKAGKVEDTRHGLVEINGAAIGGKNAIQRLRFDENNQLIAEENADHQARTDWHVTTGTGSTSTMEARLRQLREWIANPVLGTNAAAVAAWQAEVGRLEEVIAQARADAGKAQIVVGDISASPGNVILRGDAFHGAGRISASGGAEIEISTASDAILEVGDVTLDVHDGGIVSFNGTQVRDLAHAREVLGVKAEGLQTEIARAGSGAAGPKVLISASRAGGIVMQVGDIMNLGGEVSLSAGRILAYGKQYAQVLRIDASEDVSFEYEPGMRHTSGTAPEQQHAEAIAKRAFEALDKLTGLNPETSFRFIAPIGDAEFSPPTDIGVPTISAATGIFIAADAVNVNSYIRAGVSSYDISLDARLDSVLAQIKGSAPVLLWDPMTGAQVAGVTPDMVQSNARISYDPTSGRILVDDLVATAGNIEITGDIFSTGGGRLEVLDGYGKLKLVSGAGADIELGRVIIGGTLDEDGLPITTRGRIVLNDIDNSQPGGKVVTSVFTRATASDPREQSYQTKGGRDYIYTSSLLKSEAWKSKQKQSVVLGIEVAKNTTTTHEETVRPVLTTLAEAPYLAASLAGERYDYALDAYVTSQFSTSTPRKQVKDSTFLGNGWRYYEWETAKTTTAQFEHRFRADHAIQIGFSGQEASPGQTLMDVQAKGSVIFGAEVTNFGGATKVISQAGSIEAGNSHVTLGLGDALLEAKLGGIGQTEGGLRILQETGSSLQATARTGITLSAPRSGLNLGQITATHGNVRVMARDDLSQVSGATWSAQNITLESQTGAVGTAREGIELRMASGGRLRAEAQGDVHLRGGAGDLNVDLVRSAGGSVHLSTDGMILDANEAQTSDLRSADESAALWEGAMGVTSRESDGFRERVARYETERTQLYERYWQAREASGKADLAFSFTAAEAKTLREAGYSTAMIAELEASYSEAWAGFATEASRTEGFRYVASQAEVDALAEATLVDREALRRSLSAQLVRERSSTVVEEHAPNIVAHGDIILQGAKGVGADLPTRYIDMTQYVSDADLTILNEALTTDLDFSRDGFIGVRRHDDLVLSQTNLDASGRPLGAIDVQSAGNVHLASSGSLLLRQIQAGGSVTMRAGGSLEGQGAGHLVRTGGDLVLEAGSGHIGRAGHALQVAVGGDGVVNLRSLKGITLSTADSLVLAEVYTPGQVNLSAGDAITDAYDTGAARIVAGGISLRAAHIGSPSRGLFVRLLSESEIAPYRDPEDTELRGLALHVAEGDLALRIDGDATLLDVVVADDARITSTGGLTLAGALSIADDLALSVKGALEGSGAVTAQDIDLSAGRLGSATQALVLNQTSGGSVALQSLSSSQVAIGGEAQLIAYDAKGSGKLTVDGMLRLGGEDTIRFGDTLHLSASGLDLTQASGTHLSGGLLRLDLDTGAGHAGLPLTSALRALDYSGGHPIVLHEADALALHSTDWLANGSVLRVGGALALQSATGEGVLWLEHSAAPEHRRAPWQAAPHAPSPLFLEEFQDSRKWVPVMRGSASMATAVASAQGHD